MTERDNQITPENDRPPDLGEKRLSPHEGSAEQNSDIQANAGHDAPAEDSETGSTRETILPGAPEPDASAARSSTGPERFWPQTSLTLIQKMQSGDNRSWSDFVRLYGTLITGFCRRRLPASDVDDIVQRIFMMIHKGISKFHYDRKRGSFGGWIGKITRNEILRQYAKNEKNRTVSADSDIRILVAGTSQAEWDDEYTKWLADTAFKRVQEEVSENQWKLFEACWKTNLSAGEVADHLNVDVTSVYKARFHVSRKLRDIIRELTDDHPFSEPID